MSLLESLGGEFKSLAEGSVRFSSFERSTRSATAGIFEDIILGDLDHDEKQVIRHVTLDAQLALLVVPKKSSLLIRH